MNWVSIALMEERNLPGKAFGNTTSISESEKSKEERHIESLLSDLVGILDSELEQYRILIDTLVDQRRCFANGDIASFEEINKRQGTLVLKIKTLEEARKSIISQLAYCFNIPKEEVTLAKLTPLIDEPYDECLSVLSEDIIDIIGELDSIRESNAYLIKHSLHYVSGVLRIFASSHSPSIKYSDNGQIEQEQDKGKLVSGWG